MQSPYLQKEETDEPMTLVFARRSIVRGLSGVETIRGSVGAFSLEVGPWEGA